MEMQARLVSACGAVFNFILDHCPNDQMSEDDSNVNDDGQNGAWLNTNADETDADSPLPTQRQVKARRDKIAQAMWDSYVEIQQQRIQSNQHL